ncbi:MAG: hypothetical protein QG657_3386 [Acidobacteriota bacterium]|nr:hypothetical protein [Acidobacteriota bacterium]
MRIVKISLFIAAILFINALFFIQVYYSFSNWKHTNALFSVTQIYSLPYKKIIPFRLPGQKKDLIFAMYPEITDTPWNMRLNIISPFTKTIDGAGYVKDMLIPRYWSYFKPCDPDNDGEIEFPVFGSQNKAAVLERRDINGNILKKSIFESVSIPFSTDTMDIKIEGIEDIDLDGNKEVVWKMSADWDGLPRGLAVHDLLSGKKKWEFLYGPTPTQTIVKDINDDGKREIIFTAKAPHNGIECNGMNDDTSYIGILDSNGKSLWIKEAGSFFTQLFIAVEDLDHDGKFEVITARSCHRELNPDPGQIQIYDAVSGNILHSFLNQGVSFINLYAADMSNDTNLEIISSDNGGNLRIWDHNLKIMGEYNNDASIRVLGVEKIPGNKFPFIFTWCSLKNFRVFDNRLRPIFNHQFANEVLYPDPVVPVSDGEKTSFIFSTDFTYMITPKSGIPFKDYLLLIQSSFTLYLLGLFIFNVLLYSEFKKKKKLKSHYLELMREGSTPDWANAAQEALHKMKSPLTVIRLETEKIEQLLEKNKQPKTLPLKLKQISLSILDGVNDLKIMNRLLMQLLQAQTRRLQEIQLKDIIMELVDTYRTHPTDKFSIKPNFPMPLPTFLADGEKLKEALLNIINNAIDAAPNGGTIAITAIFHKVLHKINRKNIICVEVEDTGAGIPDEKLDKIFEPYYTTKKDGTGIGLAIAKRIIESHDGWIEVESKEKVGTKFAIYFPVKNLPPI